MALLGRRYNDTKLDGAQMVSHLISASGRGVLVRLLWTTENLRWLLLRRAVRVSAHASEVEAKIATRKKCR